jgi:hypothetical protein
MFRSFAYEYLLCQYLTQDDTLPLHLDFADNPLSKEEEDALQLAILKWTNRNEEEEDKDQQQAVDPPFEVLAVMTESFFLEILGILTII